MLDTMDILSIVEEEETCDSKQLAKRLGISLQQLEKILRDLSKKNVLEYDAETGEIKLPQWLSDLDKEIEEIKPTVGTIVLPKNQEIKLQDMVIGNLTDMDLELNVTLTMRRKEIAICKIT
jgi:predicted transcriptional regulator